jgi:hypothetical protein
MKMSLLAKILISGFGLFLAISISATIYKTLILQDFEVLHSEPSE